MKRKILLRAVLALAAIITVIALFYAWTDWTGARRWKAVEASLLAQGEPLSISDIEPAPIADELNFASAPIFAELSRVPDTEQWRLSAIKGFPSGGNADSSPLVGAARNLDPKFTGTDADAARRVLQQTEQWRPLLDEVRLASQRPGTAWPVNYRDGFRMKLNYVSPLVKLGQTLTAEAKARLELGDSEAALANFRLILDLSNRTTTPPLLVNHLVRQSLVGLDLSVLHYGLDRHRWNDSQLAAIERLLAEISLPRGLVQALRGERVIFNQALVEMNGQGLRDLFATANQTPAESRWLAVYSRLLPRGWTLDERSFYSEALQKGITQLNGPPGPALTSDFTSMPGNWASPLRLSITHLTLASIAPSFKRTIQAQTLVDLARIACALERYRLQHQSLPVNLATLVPTFLPKIPTDLISGGPLRYLLQGPDRAVLYGVGWNQADDGANGVDPAHPQRRNSVDAPDWTWNVE